MRGSHCAPSFLVVIVVLSIMAYVVHAEPSSQDEPSDLIVHEWGTFLSMQGSDGTVLDGMYHEEHALPDFVHSRGRDQLRISSMRLKGETPVIYFYTDRKQKVGVNVQFPAGIWTQWYPQASHVAPGMATLGSALEPRNGQISWNVELLPASGTGAKPPALPATSTDALWNFARDVDAAYVMGVDRTTKRERSEPERFIFYRGLGRARLPLEMSFRDGGTLLSMSQNDVDILHLFVIRVENRRGAYRYLPRLQAGQTASNVIPQMDESLPLDEFTAKISDDLASGLTGSALYPKEAHAMVNTWRTSYFQTDGIRVLFVMPQKWTDAFIPMQITPAPKELVRVMVARLEILTSHREVLAEKAVKDLVSPDAQARDAAFQFLREQGRYVEPIVRRVLAATEDQSVRSLCQRLLLTDFVTELRSALNSPANGSRLSENPLYVRAKLASLLRDVGLKDEARVEAERVLKGLTRETEPDLSNPEARHYLRAKARALDGLGDDAAAAEWYGKLIQYGAQVRAGNHCTTCHQGNDAPRDLSWYRDWWAGKNFGNAVRRTGKLEEQVAAQEDAVLRDGHNVSALMMLAYLYEASGEHPDARATWAKLGVDVEPVIAKSSE